MEATRDADVLVSLFGATGSLIQVSTRPLRFGCVLASNPTLRGPNCWPSDRVISLNDYDTRADFLHQVPDAVRVLGF